MINSYPSHVLYLTFSAMLPAIFKPVVMYTSPNSAVIKWEELRRKQEKDGYTIEYGKNWQNSKMVQVSKSSNTAIISDLEPDTLYNIRVLVPGTILPGPSVSFRTKPVASARIGVPQNITLVPLPFYKLLVSWDLPYRARASDVVHYSLVFAPVYSPYLRKTSLLLPVCELILIISSLRTADFISPWTGSLQVFHIDISTAKHSVQSQDRSSAKEKKGSIQCLGNRANCRSSAAGKPNTTYHEDSIIKDYSFKTP